MSTVSTSKAAYKIPTVKELLEAGTHFGHETKRWNPNFRNYIYTKRGNFHIIDLEKTLEKLTDALSFLSQAVGKGEIIFIGSKRQARDIVKEEAIRAGAHFVVNRWVGGQLTNFSTIHKGIERLREVESILNGDISDYSQQELSIFRREWARLDRLYGGVKTMDKLPKAVIVVDAHYERIAVKEARAVHIPIVAVVDSNSDPTKVDYPIPANDDAIKSVQLLVKVIADAVLAGNRGNGVKYEFKDLSHIGIKEFVVEAKEKITKEEPEVVEKKAIRQDSTLQQDSGQAGSSLKAQGKKKITKKTVKKKVKQEAGVEKEERKEVLKKVAKKEKKSKTKKVAKPAKKPVVKKTAKRR